jgi:hypothetical protein
MLFVPVPEISWSDIKLQLGGLEYTFTWSFNGRDLRWRFDLYLGEEPVITGVKIVESQSLLERYQLPEFDHGDLYCVRVGASFDDVGRDNLGFGKNYQIVYLTNEELSE